MVLDDTEKRVVTLDKVGFFSKVISSSSLTHKHNQSNKSKKEKHIGNVDQHGDWHQGRECYEIKVIDRYRQMIFQSLSEFPWI